MIPTRPASDGDPDPGIDGRPVLERLAFFVGLHNRFTSCGSSLRPRKLRRVWLVRRWGDRPLLIETDQDHPVPERDVAL